MIEFALPVMSCSIWIGQWLSGPGCHQHWITPSSRSVSLSPNEALPQTDEM